MHPVFHVSLLKNYNDPTAVQEAQPLPQPLDWLDGTPTFLVDKIVAHKYTSSGRRRSVTYCIKWKGFDDRHNTWEPYKQLKQDVPDMVVEYDQENGVIHKLPLIPADLTGVLPADDPSSTLSDTNPTSPLSVPLVDTPRSESSTRTAEAAVQPLRSKPGAGAGAGVGAGPKPRRSARVPKIRVPYVGTAHAQVPGRIFNIVTHQLWVE